MYPKLGLSIVLVYILISQSLSVIAQIQNLQQQYLLLHSAIISSVSILIAMLIFIERRNLERLRIDRISILIFILGTFPRIIFAEIKGFWFIMIIVSSGLLCMFVLFSNWQKIPKGNWRWAGIGVFVGLIVAVLNIIIVIISEHTTINNHFLTIRFVTVFAGQLIYFLSFTSPTEEILFRGFLWGYFVNFGWSERKACWIQAIIFIFYHWDKLFTPLVFFIGLPIFTLSVSKLRQGSKQVFPSLLAHTIVDALTSSTLKLIF